MPAAVSLSELLSRVLLAFTIEFDNEFERRMAETWARPFKTSMVMWSNVMQFAADEGTTLEEVGRLGCVSQNSLASIVGGLERWGYLQVDRALDKNGAKNFGSGRGVKPQTIVRPSVTGTLAKSFWGPLGSEIEGRWIERFGQPRVDALRDGLASIHDHSDQLMPPFLPVVNANLFVHRSVELREGQPPPDRELPTLLSRVLLAFTLDYERDAKVSLPIAANVLRVIGTQPRPVGELPMAAGVSKEAVALSLTPLQAQDLVKVENNPEARGKVASLTSTGKKTQEANAKRLADIEDDWVNRFGEPAIGALRTSLESILTHESLSAGLVPSPNGWRATGRYKAQTAAFVEQPTDALPAYPMVLHRGGWPDGS
jgi:hypothetical protein